MLRKGNILLRPISINDTEFILELRNDLEIASNFFSDPPVYDYEHLKWLNNHPKDIDLIIEYDGEKVGRIRLTNVDYRNQKAEYGIVLKKEYRRKGIAKTASRLLIDYVFNNLPIRKIYLHVFEDNNAAIGLYKKLGFKVEGVFKEEIFKSGSWKNVLRMALFRDEYIEKQKVEGNKDR